MMAVYRPLDMFSERLGRMRVYCYTCIVANFLMLLDRDVPRIHENVSRVCSLVEGYYEARITILETTIATMKGQMETQID